ncbi:hypothetical protein GCM10010156_47040 [Planobispora rosea]|uniref:Uncharacterized protein n=1 Tax=Planobispora rosea TaxID=35762 RepID=A0A8J3WDS4_PLARO|nr:hypothetical protein [Planobispora rosea]GGS82977.1 hypothetical protein GCM10010156_47040 [Planobispora rosea]GIH84181.1 hypothetical protein Pro02_25890 [Planobispora rosea]
MVVEWSRQEILSALRKRLLCEGAVTDGYSGADVIADSDTMLVIFRWKRDPNMYAVEVGFPEEPESPWTGLPVTSADEWAAEVGSRLAEELGTGLVCRGRRTIRGGYVVLDAYDAPDVSPAGFFVGPVPLDNDIALLRGPGRRTIRTWIAALRSGFPRLYAAAGSHLAEAGMDVTVPRQLIIEGRLACWVQAYADNAHGEPFVGHAVASWEDGQHTIARLDLVHIQPDVPSEVCGALVRLALCEVAEAGALHVVTAIHIPELHGLGFRPANGGGLTLHLSSAEPPPGGLTDGNGRRSYGAQP